MDYIEKNDHSALNIISAEIKMKTGKDYTVNQLKYFIQDNLLNKLKLENIDRSIGVKKKDAELFDK